MCSNTLCEMLMETSPRINTGKKSHLHGQTWSKCSARVRYEMTQKSSLPLSRVLYILGRCLGHFFLHLGCVFRLGLCGYTYNCKLILGAWREMKVETFTTWDVDHWRGPCGLSLVFLGRWDSMGIEVGTSLEPWIIEEYIWQDRMYDIKKEDPI